MPGVRKLVLKRDSAKRTAWILVLVPAVAWAVTGLYGVHRYAVEIDRVLNCGLNLRLVGEALQIYVAELPPGHNLPIDGVVGDLIQTGRLAPQTATCAIYGKPFCFRGTTAALLPPVNEQVIIGYELDTFHRPDVGVNVLFANGHARILKAAEYRARWARD